MKVGILFFIIFMISSFFLFSDFACAGSFKVSPTKVFLDTKRNKEKLTIKNEGGKLTLQLSVFQWRQDSEGNDIHEPTKDIEVTPRMLTLEKEEEGIVRVGTKVRQRESELSYRLFIEELPVKKPADSGIGIKMLLRVGVPIFIRPIKEKKEGLIEELGLQNGKIKVKVKNNGTTHLMLSSVKATGYDEADKEAFQHRLRGGYLLPHASKVYTFDLSQDVCLKLKGISLHIETIEGLTLTKKVDIKEGDCQR